MVALKFAGLEDNVTKVIGVFHALGITGEIADQVLDEKLSLIASEEEKEVRDFYRGYFKEHLGVGLSGTPFLFVAEKKGKYNDSFHSIDRFHALEVAIKLHKKVDCECKISFAIDDSKNPPFYYAPHFHFDFVSDYTYLPNGRIEINAEDFVQIKKLYAEIIKLKLGHIGTFSRLKNAVDFYVHANNEKWFLQKIVLSFIALESLFSDNKSEISYKIAVRTARFLAPDNETERKRIYKMLRTGYGARSTFVHGSKVNTEKLEKELGMENVQGYSVWHDYPKDLDNLVGQVLLKILTDAELIRIFSAGDSKELTDLFEKLVLG